jgi:hypothetical protein
MPRSERNDALLERLQALCNTPPQEVQPQYEVLRPSDRLPDDTGFLPPLSKVPWYNEFVVPERLVNWISNLTVGEFAGIAFSIMMVVILITIRVFVHPN